MNKLFYVFLICILILSGCKKDEPLPDIVDIPDENFLNALIEKGVDRNGDSSISYKEAEVVIILELMNRKIINMAGIEAFVNLETLKCDHNMFCSLILTNNSALKILWCNYNGALTDINVSKNIALEIFGCSGTAIKSLNVTNNRKLIDLGCCENNLFRLDVSNNTALEHIDLVRCSGLGPVCVWTMPFPPVGVEVNTYDSPDVFFTTDCSK